MRSSISTFLICVLFFGPLAGCGGGGGPQVPDGIGSFPSPPPVTLSVNAGPDQTLIEGDSVVLQGNITAAQNCYADYEWRQTQGPNVDVRYFVPGDLTATIHTPPVLNGSPLTLTLAFAATCNDGSTDSDSVSVFVQPTSAAALCLQAPDFATTYVWEDSGCTSDSAEIAGDTRVATISRLGEAEPNDTYGEANPLVFPAQITAERIGVDVDAFVSGMAGTISDFDDYFSFTPPETGVYEIFLCNDPVLCTRGTVSDKWVLELRDQNFDSIASTNRNEVTELKLRVHLDAGLPYYVWVDVFEVSWSEWDYNLTILSADN